MESNKLIADRINLIKNPDPFQIFNFELLRKLLKNDQNQKFVLCNPPFYTNQTDLELRRSFKRHKPVSGNWQMTEGEMGTELGGEVGFIKKMIQESLELPNDLKIV